VNATDNRAIVIGGSLAGLFAGTLLRSIGWQVNIYERSPHTLDSRGGGIVLQPDVDEWDLDPETAAIFTERFVFYQLPNSHILQYVIPGENESLVPGERRFNWVWYVNYDEATELPRILNNVAKALEAWEVDRLALGMRLWQHGQDLGDQSQFTYGTGRFEGEQ
jgi:hypothetical protein